MGGVRRRKSLSKAGFGNRVFIWGTLLLIALPVLALGKECQHDLECYRENQTANEFDVCDCNGDVCSGDKKGVCVKSNVIQEICKEDEDGKDKDENKRLKERKYKRIVYNNKCTEGHPCVDSKNPCEHNGGFFEDAVCLAVEAKGKLRAGCSCFSMYEYDKDIPGCSAQSCYDLKNCHQCSTGVLYYDNPKVNVTAAVCVPDFSKIKLTDIYGNLGKEMYEVGLKDSDPCDSTICLQNMKCVATDYGGSTCVCKDNFVMIGNEGCVENICREDKNPCGKSATCQMLKEEDYVKTEGNSVRKFSCTCADKENEYFDYYLKECLPTSSICSPQRNPCGQYGTCQLQSDFKNVTCACAKEEGFTLEWVHYKGLSEFEQWLPTCAREDVVNPCTQTPFPCGKNASCEQSLAHPEKPVCYCPGGYVGEGTLSDPCVEVKDPNSKCYGPNHNCPPYSECREGLLQGIMFSVCLCIENYVKVSSYNNTGDSINTVEQCKRKRELLPCKDGQVGKNCFLECSNPDIHFNASLQVCEKECTVVDLRRPHCSCKEGYTSFNGTCVSDAHKNSTNPNGNINPTPDPPDPNPQEPTNEAIPKNGSDSDDNTVLYACLGGGIGALVIISIIVFFCLKKKRNKRKRRANSSESELYEESSVSVSRIKIADR
eukprot:Nk52_evm44s621 gene=Nk52_evmTU44s621